MIARLPRAAVGAGTLILLTLLGCDAINPQLIGQLGGNPSSTNADISGSILVVFNNNTTGDGVLTYSASDDSSGSSVVLFDGSMTAPSGYTNIASYECSTTTIAITGISIGGTDLTWETVQYTVPNLRCGSVIFVNVQGTVTAPTVTTELFN